jgi:cbb3-type cytochrome oxidase subunit 3
MSVAFLALAAWPFRPGSRKRNEAAARMIFESDDHGE